MWSYQELIKLKSIKKNYKYKNFINILLYLILFSIYFPFGFSKDINNIKRNLEYENELTIKIFGSGEKYVVYQWETITAIIVSLRMKTSGEVNVDTEYGSYQFTNPTYYQIIETIISKA
jgi:hypothetical protein